MRATSLGERWTPMVTVQPWICRVPEQFATLARHLLPAAIAQDVLVGGSAEVADLSFRDELAFFV